jgi:fibronectin type 3 domain-containing protein
VGFFSLRGPNNRRRRPDKQTTLQPARRNNLLRIEQLESRSMLSVAPSLLQAADVQLSIPSLSATAGGTVTVPINIDNANPTGAAGLASAEIGLTYDPQVFTVAAADVQLGSLDGSNWSILPQINQTTGEISIGLTAADGQQITSTAAGSLATVTFHINLNAVVGNSTIGIAASVEPTGVLVDTSLSGFDNQVLVLDPAPVNGVDDSVTGTVDVQAAASIATPVSLASDYNLVGITADGATFSGGLDGAGNALSANELGTSQTWNNVPFTLGAAGSNNVVQALGQSITLPAGQFSQLDLLATGVMGSQRYQSFTVNYTDGTSTVVTQSISDWYVTRGFLNESVAVTMPYRNTSTGAADNRSFAVFGYSFTINGSKTVSSITLPDNADVDVLAVTAIGTVATPTALAATAAASDEVNLSWVDPSSTVTGYNIYRGTASGDEFGSPVNATPLPPGATSFQDTSVLGGNKYYYVIQALNGPAVSYLSNEATATTPVNGNDAQVDLSGNFNHLGLSNDGVTFAGGLDDDGNALSATRLGTGLTWNNVSFQLGTPDTYDVMSSVGQTLALPAAQFTKLSFLATAVDGDQLSEVFVVTYTDGTTASLSQSFSDWYSPQAFTGEAVAAATPYRDMWDGKTDHRTFDVYGYSIPLDSTKTVSSITLPDDSDIQILAITGVSPTTAAAAPSGLTAAAVSSSEIDLSWTAAAGTVTGYNVYRGTASGGQSPTPLNSTPLSSAVTNYQDTTAAAGTSYYYVVKALDGTGISQGSDEAMTTTASNVSTTMVSLASAFNQVGIATDAATFSGGLDGAGHALSANLLTGSQTWNGVNFDIGAAGADNVVEAEGQTITLPAGQFSQLNLLATAVLGNQPSQTFTVTYTDGTTASLTQNISGWDTPQGYAGESVAVTTSYRDTSTGGLDHRSFSVYGYTIVLDGSKTVSSITLPNAPDVKLLAITGVGAVAAPTSLAADSSVPGQVSLTWTAPAGTLTGYNVYRGTSAGGESTSPLNSTPLGAGVTSYVDSSVVAGNSYYYVVQAVNGPVASASSNEATVALAASGSAAQVDLTSAFNVAGITADGVRFGTGLDGVGDTLSATNLGTSIAWNGAQFNIGQAGSNNVVSAAGQTIALAAGQFSKLEILATAVEGNQLSQTFTVHYTDGTTTVVTQSLSDWYTSQAFAGESIAVATPYRNTWSGDRDNRTFTVYGYTLNLDSSKTVASITLPNNGDVNVLAMTAVQ